MKQKQQAQIALYNPPANSSYLLMRVKQLKIYYSRIESLRDLGTGWSNLIQLSVYFGRLKDLSGLSAFPSLQYLHCPFNFISTISDVMFSSKLISIDLQSNSISELCEVEHLFTVENLEYINLINNPVYLKKESRRKINQKFDKIIDSQNTRFEDYLNQRQRENWELINIQAVQYCNSILLEFFKKSRADQITVQSKHQLFSKQSQKYDLQFEAFEKNSIQPKSCQTQKELQFRIEYIPPEAPQNFFFYEMISKGSIQDSQVEFFSQQKINLTPLSSFFQKKQTYIGPVLNKYLQNKVYQCDYHKKPKPKNQNTQLSGQNNSVIKNQSIKKQKKLDTAAFSSRGFVQSELSTASFEQISHNIQNSNQFGTTKSSLSTNYTNLNNISSSKFCFRKARLTSSQSKQKSSGKILFQSQFTETLNTNWIKLNSNSIRSSFLVKHPRHSLNKSLKKDNKIRCQVSNQSSDHRHLQRNNNLCILCIHSLQKQSFQNSQNKKKPELS